MNADTAVIDARDIDALLPQTQCTRCGHAGCLPYAQAIAGGVADINQCPPGGDATVQALAALLGRDPKPLNPVHGLEQPAQVAWIDATQCIGCAKCLPPCPVDAILGAAKFLHTIISERCTGCELCVAPCPVDCIRILPARADSPATEAHHNRTRFHAHVERAQQRDRARALQLERKKALIGPLSTRT